ncbi:MAG: hypothetical protein MK171_00085 [Pirellulales bacterium]|nr:hypothetical protein [Pirellulales bacterium]
MSDKSSPNLAHLLLFFLCLSGCSDGPQRVPSISIDAYAAGLAAMEQYDANGDGTIGANELKDAPSLHSAIANLDTDSDGAVSAEEVAARIREWQETEVGLITGISCRVTYKGAPLAGATVIFEPEKFLGDSVRSCVGTTSKRGRAGLRMPDASHKIPGASPGFYRIKITSPHVEIPAKYNTQTVLGREIANLTGELVLNLRE